MRIERLKLVNFIGIMHSMKKDTFEITFPKTKNKIVLVKGENGSGKSTIVGSLTPFKQSTDNRTQLILDGKDGKKEIDIRHNGHLYEITHTYPAKGTSQSFIKKDGKELNENGGVKTCEDIIQKELGVSKDYFKIGKIGSNTKNFIDLTTAERKKYIGIFLDIQEIQEKFAIVNDKYKRLKQDTKAVADDLSKFEDKAVVETKIKTLEADITGLEGSLKINIGRKGSLDANITTVSDILSKLDKPSLELSLAEKKAEKEKYEQLRDSLLTEIDAENATTNKEQLQNEISVLSGDIRVNETEKTSKNALITDTQNKIIGLNTEISNLGNPEDIEKLATVMSEAQTKMDNLKNKIKLNPCAEFVNNMKKEKKDVSRYLLKFSDFVKFIEKYFSDLQKKSVNNIESNIEFFMRADCNESFARQIKQSRETVDAKQKLLTEQEKERSGLEAHRCQAESLEQRPRECTIDTCPFIAEALKWKNIGSLILEKDEEIKQSKDDLTSLNVKADNLQELSNLFELFKIALEAVSPRENSILAEFLKEKSLIDWVLGPLSEFQKQTQEMISNISSAQEDFEDYLEASREYKAAETSKTALESSDSSLKDKYEKDLKEAEELKERLDKEFAELQEKGIELSNKLTEKQTLLKKYEDYLVAISKIASNATMISNKEADLRKYEENSTKLVEYTKELTEVKALIAADEKAKEEKTREYNVDIVNLGKIKSLVERKEKLNKEFEPVKTVHRILSSGDGIQLILQNVYLKETERIANELLDIAYNGEFKIKFNNETPDAFLINVQTKDNIKDDISLASQGEIALTTISISLALIQQALGDYNIIGLDEMDGPLDKKNRGNFISILTSQIDRLGIEQVFVISHNDAFDTCPVDLVLLNGNDVDTTNQTFMTGKTVIYDSTK